jgi:hypothetical protein
MMPYINLEDRGLLIAGMKQPLNAGELNYLISDIVHQYILAHGLRYTNLNEAIGALECAKLELYRMVAAPYEDKKRLANGPVSELDDDSKRRMR